MLSELTVKYELFYLGIKFIIKLTNTKEKT